MQYVHHFPTSLAFSSVLCVLSCVPYLLSSFSLDGVFLSAPAASLHLLFHLHIHVQCLYPRINLRQKHALKIDLLFIWQNDLLTVAALRDKICY
jgi:hypothetical protein